MKYSKFLWLSLVVGSLAIAGCNSGDDTAEGGEEAAEASGEEAAEEEPTTQPAGEAAAAGGDFTASAAALQGTWGADFQAMLAGQEMTEEERAMATAFLAGATMNLTFNADGTLAMNGVMMGQEQSETGTWSEVGAAGNVLTVSTTTTSEGAEAETETMTVTFASATSITIADPEGEAIPFNKAQ